MALPQEWLFHLNCGGDWAVSCDTCEHDRTGGGNLSQADNSGDTYVDTESASRAAVSIAIDHAREKHGVKLSVQGKPTLTLGTARVRIVLVESAA